MEGKGKRCVGPYQQLVSFRFAIVELFFVKFTISTARWSILTMVTKDAKVEQNSRPCKGGAKFYGFTQENAHARQKFEKDRRSFFKILKKRERKGGGV